MKYLPKYIQSHKLGQLKEIRKILTKRMMHCDLCPRKCEINRKENERGICNTGKHSKIASYGPHYGEEKPLVGQKGSGTIFFSNCNLLCNFCQNYDISHKGAGVEVDSQQLSDIMISLQETGCHNINFVTPSHVVPQILEALEIAIDKDLSIPLVYNSSAYDDLETIKLLKGIIDIYMPDFKFWNPDVAELTCRASDYTKIAKDVIKEMYYQVGTLQMNEINVAETGLLIRHLVMPNDYSGTKDVLKFIAEEISTNTFINIMSQYHPTGKAYNFTEISRPITNFEFQDAINSAKKLGLTNFL